MLHENQVLDGYDSHGYRLRSNRPSPLNRVHILVHRCSMVV
jgi:hypothetical protein